jgi:hypothetical protein
VPPEQWQTDIIDARIQAQWMKIEKELKGLRGRINGLEKEVYGRRIGSASFSARSIEVSFREILERLEKLHCASEIMATIKSA